MKSAERAQGGHGMRVDKIYADMIPRLPEGAQRGLYHLLTVSLAWHRQVVKSVLPYKIAVFWNDTADSAAFQDVIPSGSRIYLYLGSKPGDHMFEAMRQCIFTRRPRLPKNLSVVHSLICDFQILSRSNLPFD
jgi:hypothetical protein